MPDAASQEVRQSLLRRILTSPHFAHAESLKLILLYLNERSADQEAPAAKEYDIATAAIGRPRSFDPKTDPIIRVSIASIRERLRAYFDNEGRGEPLRLSIPKGQYRVVITETEASQQPAVELQALHAFWAPYLSGRPNALVYTELLFFRDAEGNYVRNIYVNDLSTGDAELRKRLPDVASRELRPSYHFLSAGEIHSLLSISGAFRQVRAELDIRNSRFVSWAELQQCNLVFLGSSRTNPFLSSLQGKEPFIISQDCIHNTEPAAGEEPAYRGYRFMEGKLERVVEYAVVTRRPGVVSESSITLIGANHGRAIEGAGQFVTRENKLRTFLDAAGIPSTGPLPRHFQILLRVDMLDFDEEVCNVEYVAHRIVS